jgi:hypothetical protein
VPLEPFELEGSEGSIPNCPPKGPTADPQPPRTPLFFSNVPSTLSELLKSTLVSYPTYPRAVPKVDFRVVKSTLLTKLQLVGPVLLVLVSPAFMRPRSMNVVESPLRSMVWEQAPEHARLWQTVRAVSRLSAKGPIAYCN